MSWGYFVELDVSLPTSALAGVRKKKPSDIALARGWSGLRDEGLEAAFGRRLTTNDTFAKTLRWFDGGRPALPSVQREEAAGERTRLRVLTLLDKSLLDHAFPLVALLHEVRDAGGDGTLRLVNDGTSGGETGVELTITGREIVSRRLDDDWELAGRLGGELFAGPEPVAPSTPPSKKPRAKREAAPDADGRGVAPKDPARTLFVRFVETEGLAWLCASRAVEDVMASVDGEPKESSLGMLRYVHYRRALATLAPAPPAAPGFRLSLQVRSGVLTTVALVAADHPSDGDAFPPAELAEVGERWKKQVADLGKRLGMKRTASPKRGPGNAQLAFQGKVEDTHLALEWQRTVIAVAGALRENYAVFLRRV